MAPGFEYNFVDGEGVVDDFKCSICHGIIQQATNGCDAHIFCKSCIQEYLSNKGESPYVCPGGCEIAINPSELLPNKFVDQLILKLEVKCENCDWTGTLLNLQQHHKSRCEMTPCKCKYEGCDVIFKSKDAEKHDDKCLFKPIKCQDCYELFPRKSLSSHSDVCPMKIVDCCFKNVGCEEQKTRESMITHMDSSVQYHLMLSNKQMLLFKENCFSVVNDNQVLKEEIITLKKDFNEQLTMLKNEIDEMKHSQKELAKEKKEAKEVKVDEMKAVISKETFEAALKKIEKILAKDNKQHPLRNYIYFDKRKGSYNLNIFDFSSSLKCQDNATIRRYLEGKDFSQCCEEIITNHNNSFAEIKEELNIVLKGPTSYIFRHIAQRKIFCFNLNTIEYYHCVSFIFYNNSSFDFYQLLDGSFIFKGSGQFWVMYNRDVKKFGKDGKSFNQSINFKSMFTEEISEWTVPEQYCLIVEKFE